MGKRFEAIFKNAASYMTITGLDDGSVVDASDSFLAVIGKARAEIVGRKVVELDVWVDPLERDAIIAEIREKGSVRNREVRIRGRGGDIRTCLFFASAIDIEGAPCVFAEAIDITELRRALDGLRESEARLANLMEHIPLGIQGYGVDGTVGSWNRESERIYGYAAEEAIGRKLEDLIIPPEIKPLYDQGMAAAAKLTESGEFIPAGEVALRRKDNSPVSVYSIHTAVCVDGKPATLYCIDLDLSERRKTEEALRAKMAEAEQLNRLMMGREDRVIELKREVNDLLKQQGKPARYSA